MLNPQTAYNELRKIFDSRIEWLLIRSNGSSFAFQTNEIEFESANEKLVFGFLDSDGFQFWRVIGWKYEKERLFLELTRNFNREKTKVEIVPRIPSSEFAKTVESARIERAQDLANLIIAGNSKTKLVRVELNKESGRFAQIIFEGSNRRQTAVLADVSDTLTAEVLLTSAILWLEKLRRRKKNPVQSIWILAEKKPAKNLQKLHALLIENWREKIKIRQISNPEPEGKSPKLETMATLDFQSLFKSKSRKTSSFKINPLSATARKIIEISPDEIDARPNKNGETLCFRGLPFARIRKIFNEEKIWFGVESNRRFMSGINFGEFAGLLDELKIYRQHDSPNKQHLFYKHAPESWLESILRKNIKLLDANLILSPLYNQFRAEQDKIDLLALRRDGRLVIIEIKAAPDREMIFQAADYWRKIETARISQNLQKMRIFGDLKIKDEPALVYLAAPLLSFHKDFEFLARTISSEIEIYRFDINENWRENLKIVRQQKINRE